jgi:hypothetical protein
MDDPRACKRRLPRAGTRRLGLPPRDRLGCDYQYHHARARPAAARHRLGRASLPGCRLRRLRDPRRPRRGGRRRQSRGGAVALGSKEGLGPRRPPPSSGAVAQGHRPGTRRGPTGRPRGAGGERGVPKPSVPASERRPPPRRTALRRDGRPARPGAQPHPRLLPRAGVGGRACVCSCLGRGDDPARAAGTLEGAFDRMGDPGPPVVHGGRAGAGPAVGAAGGLGGPSAR